jgi:hypothetical protein
VNRGYQWTFYEFKWLMQEYPNASVVYGTAWSAGAPRR